MIAPTQSNLPFLLFQVKQTLYAVPCESVREILILPGVIRLPNTPPEVRGVINLRGKVIKLVDLRVRLGLPSSKSELDDLIQMLRDREQDHRNWLGELEACVRDRRPFTLARDPHQCKFGLWYDSFKTQDSLLAMTLKKFERPHRIIHAAADEALRLADRGDGKGALELLEARREQELAQLLEMFEEVRRILRENHRELAVVVAGEGKPFALTIDEVEAVERIPENTLERTPSILTGSNDGPRCAIAKRLKTNETVLLLGKDFLFPGSVPDFREPEEVLREGGGRSQG